MLSNKSQYINRKYVFYLPVKIHALFCILSVRMWICLTTRSHVFFMRGLGCAFFYYREVKTMDEKLYFEVFNKITDMIEELKQMQRNMEDAYIAAKES